MSGYNDTVRAAFFAPPLAFRGRSVGQAAAPGGSTVVRFCASADGEKLSQLGFRAIACPHIIAACRQLALQLEGQPIAALTETDWTALQLTLDVPVEKAGKLLIIQDALRSLLAAIQAQSVT